MTDGSQPMHAKVRVKPVFVGIPHYREVSGSVCSAEVEGTVKGSDDGGYCRIIVHMSVDGDVGRVPELLVRSQHVSTTFGHWLESLEEASKLLGMKTEHLWGPRSRSFSEPPNTRRSGK